jgi:UDP-2,3-diacylglucosamine pyrophosphatase LpxH
MHRAFQTAQTYFRPDLVVFLGDVFDEGKWADPDEWQGYVERFRRLFKVDPDTTEVRVIAGNHDVGFHYAVTPYLENRFEREFDISPVDRFSVKGVQFVTVNSMAMEGDGCFLCKSAEERLKQVAKEMECIEKKDACEVDYDFSAGAVETEFSRPILLQHFPLFRKSDAKCSGEDAAPTKEREKPFRPKFDCLSKESTDLLLDTLKPRAVLSGHTHHGCVVEHNEGSVQEWSVSSFSWRNRNNPTFLLATITPTDIQIQKCFMPQESTVIFLYQLAGVVALVLLLKPVFVRWKTR